jgi:threonine dehydratase
VTVDLKAMRAAHHAGRPLVMRTPVLPSAALADRVGAPVVLKAENLQRTGPCGVAGSAGNHAQGLALAARHHGVRCELFVPAGAPISKVEACRSYGAIVHEGGASLTEAMTAAQDHASAAGAVFCHPFDDPDIVNGQGTLGLELVDDVDDLSCVVVPIGGGGLAAGVAIAVKTQRPDVSVIGVQAAACAPYLGGAPPDGPVNTLADGIAVKQPGAVTRPLIERWVDMIVAVDEDTIADAMVFLLDQAKLCVEGAGAVGVAALMAGLVAPPSSGSVCVVLSGGNVDLGVVPGLIRRNETEAGRRLTVFVRIDDRPGRLARLLDIFATSGANLLEVQHVREGVALHVRETGVRASFEVRGRDHARTVVDAARTAGYAIAEEHDHRN